MKNGDLIKNLLNAKYHKFDPPLIFGMILTKCPSYFLVKIIYKNEIIKMVFLFKIYYFSRKNRRNV